MIKAAYVQAVRTTRAICSHTPLLERLERAPRNSLRFWLRTQFAIYDAADLAHLDLPWWSFGAIDQVEAWIRQRAGKVRAFEYGSGASTLWLARRCEQVISVEHDAAFAERIRPLLPADRVRFHLVEPRRGAVNASCRSGRKGYEDCDFTDYVHQVESHGPIDLLVVDGRARADCLKVAAQHVRPGGLIVFDNSDRARYQEALRAFQPTLTRYGGRAPALPIPTETALIRVPEVSAS